MNESEFMLNIFQECGINESQLHTKFKLLRDEFSLKNEREILQDWTKDFIDRDNKIVKEFQTSFHSSFWEFFLNALFSEAKFEVDRDPKKNRPDFILTNPIEMYVEAVVANIKKDGIEESSRTLEDILDNLDPFYLRKNFDVELREAITRYSNSILTKSSKYNEYSELDYFDTNYP